MRGLGARDHVATVVAKQYLAPHFVRLRMHSPTLFDEAVPDPASWVRFWFPDPDGSDSEYQRAYTFTEADPATGRFAVDVVLHEPAGPASQWARDAEPGWTVPLMALASSSFVPPADPPAEYLLVGDSASIPAMNSVLGTVPHDTDVELYLERHDPRDEQIPLASHPRLHTHWVDRGDGTALAAALEPRDWSDWYAWLAPETTTLKAVRTRLRDEFGFPRSEVH